LTLYEVMYIIQPDMESEEALEEAIEKVNNTIENTGGEIVAQKKIGKRRLAYEIDDYKEGIYVLINVRADHSFVPALEHFFKVNEGYLRYMILRLDNEKAALEPKAEKEVVQAQEEDEDAAPGEAGEAVTEENPE